MGRPRSDLPVAVVGVSFALATLAAPATGAPVDVVPGTPRVLCPDQSAVQEALSAQVGEGAPAGGWRLFYRRTDDAPGGRGQRGVLHLELADHRGQSRLRRQLRVGDGDCRAQAEAIALIVHRFFEELGGADSGPPAPSDPPPGALAAVSPPAPAPAPAPPAPASARASAPPPSPPPPALVRTSAPTGTPARLRLSLEAGVGLWTRRPGAGTGVFGLRLALASVEAALEVLAPGAPAIERRAEGGEVEASVVGIAISLGVAREGARLRLHAGPMSIVSREWGRSRGIAITGESSGTTAALGLAAGASWRLRGGFLLGFEAGLAHAVSGDRFVVGGWGRVLAPPPWQAVALARLGFAFSP